MKATNKKKSKNKMSEFEWNQLSTIAKEFEDLLWKTGLLGGQINQAEAYKRFGRQKITRWKQEGKIKPVMKKNSYYYDFDEIIMLSNQNQ